MQIKAQQLQGLLPRQFHSIYLIIGEEPQQISELSDLIRATANGQGFTTREIFFVDKSFDWSQLQVSTDNLSIFDDKKILDLRLSGATLGTEGSKSLIAFCQRLPTDKMLLVSIDKIKKEQQKSAWFQAIDKVGCIIQVWPLNGRELQQWLQNRLQQRGLHADAGVVKQLAERVEGNMLAAAQEIEKLHFLYGTGQISSQQLLSAVEDNSRYDVFKLVEAAMACQTEKLLKILNSLKSEGVAPAVVIWALAREARVLIHYKAAHTSTDKERIFKNHVVWGERKRLIEHSATRFRQRELHTVLTLSAKADRQVKGQQKGDPWTTLLAASLALASVQALVKTT